ncbi:KRI1-like family C-terminal-domain-containing protein [Sparassis latifolia]
MLSEGSDTEDIHTFTISEHYAKAYQYGKEREELAKLKEKYGSDVDEDDVESEEDSEDAESEDEDGEELTPAMDAAILRTLARIRRKDPAIYEKDIDVFEEEQQKTGDATISVHTRKNKSKPLTMRQHALASALDSKSPSPSPEPLTHYEEQAVLRSETIAAFHTAVNEDSDGDDLLVPRVKGKDELEREKEEYRAFLEKEVGEDLTHIVTIEEDGGVPSGSADEAERSKNKKKGEEKTKKSKQDEGQEFLINYILNRGWVDRSARRLPTYSEITASKKGKGKANGTSTADSDLEDEVEEQEGTGADAQSEELDEDEFDEVVDRFESSYNFRFEEPDAATIARYPRNLPSLVRREDTSRKEAREKRIARKEEELLKKKEEVKRLKALKMKELRAKLEKIGKEGGKNLEDTAALQVLDLDGDWDPDTHDRQMTGLYGNDDDADAVDEEKPQWDDEIDIDNIVPSEPSESKSKKKKKKKKDKPADVIDEGGVDVDEMDAEVERLHRDLDDEEWDGTEEMRKRKLDEYMDELYELEFNDMVGDLPTRFKYAKVEPQSFALSPVEVLMATDAELNSYMGIKKYAPYRKEGKGKHWDASRTSRLKELKAKLKERGFDPQGQDGVGDNARKRRGKKERLKERATLVVETTDVVDQNTEEVEARKELRKRKRQIPHVEEDVSAAVVDREADVVQQSTHTAKKRRRRRKHEHADI